MNRAVAEMVDAGGRTAQDFGLNRTLGKIYAFLYLSAEPLSLDQIADGLGVSKASASIACRQLQSWGAVRCTWRRGDRRDYYEAETDFSSLLGHGLLGEIGKKLESARVQIERSLRLLEGEDGESADRVAFLRERLRQAERRRARLQKVLTSPWVKRLL